MEVRAVQDLGGDRIEEGLGQLGLQVVHHEPDVVQLDLVPHLHGLVARVELLVEAAHALLDAQIVELDALALGALLAMPVGGLEAVLGARRLGAKQAVVAVEAIHHRLGDVVGLRGIKSLGKHDCACRTARSAVRPIGARGWPPGPPPGGAPRRAPPRQVRTSADW